MRLFCLPEGKRLASFSRSQCARRCAKWSLILHTQAWQAFTQDFVKTSQAGDGQLQSNCRLPGAVRRCIGRCLVFLEARHPNLKLSNISSARLHDPSHPGASLARRMSFCGYWPTFAWFATKVGPDVEIAATDATSVNRGR